MIDRLLTRIDGWVFALEVAYRRRRVAKLEKALSQHPGEMKLRRWMLQNDYDQAVARLEQYGEVHAIELKHDLKIAQDQLAATFALQRGRGSVGLPVAGGR